MFERTGIAHRGGLVRGRADRGRNADWRPGRVVGSGGRSFTPRLEGDSRRPGFHPQAVIISGWLVVNARSPSSRCVVWSSLAVTSPAATSAGPTWLRSALLQHRLRRAAVIDHRHRRLASPVVRAVSARGVSRGACCAWPSLDVIVVPLGNSGSGSGANSVIR
jgi:hypothetical protein